MGRHAREICPRGHTRPIGKRCPICHAAWMVKYRKAPSTHCRKGLHRMTDENTDIMPTGHRSCVACLTIRQEAQNEGRRRGGSAARMAAAMAIDAPATGSPVVIVRIDEGAEREAVLVDGPPKPPGFCWVRMRIAADLYAAPRVILEAEVVG